MDSKNLRENFLKKFTWHKPSMNFNKKYIYHAPCICMYCKTCYGIKSGFNAPYPSHGICLNCKEIAYSQLKGLN